MGLGVSRIDLSSFYKNKAYFGYILMKQELEEEAEAAKKEVFKNISRVEALLFDMDGVLADVTHSQHKVKDTKSYLLPLVHVFRPLSPRPACMASPSLRTTSRASRRLAMPTTTGWCVDMPHYISQ